MRKIVYILVIIVALQTAAYAEVINGTVVKVDKENSTLTIERLSDSPDSKDILPEQLRLRVLRDADLKNLTSLDELKEGNQIQVDVRENRNLGVWEAISVELSDITRG